MKYKVGDRVRIQSKEWYNKHKDEFGNVKGAFFDKERAKLCGTIQTIANSDYVDGSGIIIYAIEDAYEFIGEEAIEGLAEGTKKSPVEQLAELCNKVDKEMQDKYDKTKRMLENWEHEFPCPDGYEFKDENGNVINAQKIVLEKKKPKYPKTYEECCAIMGFGFKWVNPFSINRDTHPYIKNLDNLMEVLCKLLICRDAYWKIAGEEMGLGKPWEPDYKKERYVIHRYIDEIVKGYRQAGLMEHFILEFPTEEMRDAFYENFKDLIEECKELL